MILSPIQLKDLKQKFSSLVIASELVKNPPQIGKNPTNDMVALKIMSDLLTIHQQFLGKVEELQSIILEDIVPTEDYLRVLIKALIPEVKDGHTPTEGELVSLVTPIIERLMPKVENGHTPTAEELVALMRPLIPQVKDGETPSDERLLSLMKKVMPKINIEEIARKAAALIPPTETPEPINEETLFVSFLEYLKTNKISMDFIDGLDKAIKNLDLQTRRAIQVGGGGVPSLTAGANITLTRLSDGGFRIASTGSGSSTPVNNELLGTGNGSTKVYTTLNSVDALSLRLFVDGIRQVLTSDYSISAMTITFVNAPPVGKLITCDYTTTSS